MVEIDNLLMTYKDGDFRLDIPNLTIKEGEIVGIVGNNGAGKTTFLRLILDLLKADSGIIKLGGWAVNSNDVWKTFTGAYLDEHSLIDFLTPTEYFDFIAQLNKMNTQQLNERLSAFNDFFDSKEFANRKYIKEYSTGNKQKTGIVAALLPNPKIVILDEPFSNLDPSSQIAFKKIIQNMNGENQVTFLISSHNLDHVSDVCKRVLLFENGRIRNDMPVTEDAGAFLSQYFSKQI